MAAEAVLTAMERTAEGESGMVGRQKLVWTLEVGSSASSLNGVADSLLGLGQVLLGSLS